MSLVVKGNHPLAEVIAKRLFGIENTPKEYQQRMVNSACAEAVKWHEKDVMSIKQFYLRRMNALQKYQANLPEPYRTEICNILANGVSKITKEE